MLRQLKLESQISVLEGEFKYSRCKSSHLKLGAARSALDELLTQKAETAISLLGTDFTGLLIHQGDSWLIW